MSRDEAWQALGLGPAAQPGLSGPQKLTHAAPNRWFDAAGKTVTAVNRLLSGSGIWFGFEILK